MNQAAAASGGAFVHTEVFRHQRRLTRSTLAALAGAALSALGGLAATIVLTRRLGFDDVGLYAIGFAACTFLSLLSRLGLEVSSVRFPSHHLSQGNHAVAAAGAWRALLVAVSLGVVAAALLLAAAAPISQFLGLPQAAVAIQLFAPAIPLVNLLFVATEALRASQRVVESLAPRLVLFPSLLIAGFATVLAFERTVAAAVAVTVVAWGASAAVALLLFARAYPHVRTTKHQDAVVHFGAWGLVMQLLHFAVLWLPVALVARVAGPTETGLMRVASQTALLATVPVTASEMMFAPLCSAFLARNDLSSLRATARSIARTTFILTGSGLLFVLLAPELVLGAFGPSVGPAIPAFLILIAAQAVTSVLGPSTYALIMGDRLRLEVVANVAAVLVGAGVGLATVPHRGLLAAALAGAAALLARALLRWAFLRRTFHVDPFSPRLAVGFAAVALLYGAGRAIVAAGVPPAVAAGAAAGLFLLTSARWMTTRKDRTVMLAAASRALPPSEVASPGGPPWPSPRTVSVIICTRERAVLAANLVERLSDQTRPADEVVVVDGSRTPELAQRLPPHVRYLHLPDSRGLTEQRNAGIDASTGDVCLFLDDDVVPDPDLIERILETYRDHPRAGGVGGVPVVERGLSPLRRLFLHLFQRGPFGYPRAFYDPRARAPDLVHRLSGCVQSYRREVLREIRFDETIRRPQRGEDMDMSWRVSRRHPIYLVPQARVRHQALGWNALDLRGRFEAKVVSYRNLYRKNLRGRWPMTMLYAWLLVGIVGEATLYTLLHRSLRPLVGLRDGFAMDVGAPRSTPVAAPRAGEPETEPRASRET